MRPSVLILGACSDIAVAIAHEYARHGHDLLLAARRVGRLEHEANNLRIRHGIEVSLHEFDALAFESHPRFFSGLPRLPEGVMCAVGYLGNQAQAELEFEEARRILDSNMTGPLSILNLVAQAFAERGSGFMVVISSVAGDRGRQSNYHYGSAKAGLTAYLSGLRNRMNRHGVQVLTVKPGFVETAMTKDLMLPARLTVAPERIARDVFRAQQSGRDVLYTPWFWAWIMRIIRSIPERIFKRLSL